MMIKEKYWIVIATLVILVGILFFGTFASRTLSIEGITYPKATSDLSIIEMWSEREVYSFSDDLGCFAIPYNNEFEEQFPEEVEFCRKVRNIWGEKYDKGKENNTNWRLYRSLEGR